MQKSFKKEDIEYLLIEQLKRNSMAPIDTNRNDFIFMWNAHSDVMIVFTEKKDPNNG